MVLADGSIVTASSQMNPDLFWAIRGCGSCFGVAVEFTFQGYDQKNTVWSGLLIFTPDKLDDIVKFANHHHSANNGDQAMVLALSAPPPLNQPVILVGPFFNGPDSEAETYFADLLALGPVVNQVGGMPYEKLNGILVSILYVIVKCIYLLLEEKEHANYTFDTSRTMLPLLVVESLVEGLQSSFHLTWPLYGQFTISSSNSSRSTKARVKA
jgi:hypothetical protein